MTTSTLMNISDLKALGKECALTGEAKCFEGKILNGFLLTVIDENNNRYSASTYISKQKLYVKPEALLKDAQRIGLKNVNFLID